MFLHILFYKANKEYLASKGLNTRKTALKIFKINSQFCLTKIQKNPVHIFAKKDNFNHDKCTNNGSVFIFIYIQHKDTIYLFIRWESYQEILILLFFWEFNRFELVLLLSTY